MRQATNPTPSIRHLLSLAVAATLCVLAGAPLASGACGSHGYSYAGIRANAPASGISARLTALRKPFVQNGHVAAWVGVGGAGLGIGGRDEWLQVGIAAFPNGSSELYYEFVLPGRAPVFVTVRRGIAPGSTHVLAVLEERTWPGAWRVWVDGRAVTRAIYLSGSHGAWPPIATTETWAGGVPSCNAYMYRFADLRVAAFPGGRWSRMTGGRLLQDPGYRVVAGASGFVADGA